MTTTFSTLLRKFTAAAEAGDGAAFAACFTENGAYHDVFYGTFRGREKISELLTRFFHRDGADFRWDMIDPIAASGRGYARYLFSYRSLLPGREGRRVLFEGVAHCRLEGGLISDYAEVANAAAGLSLLGFDAARLARFTARQAAELTARPESARHLA